MKFSVLWTITDPKAYLFNVRDPDDMVRAAGESAMREIVGRSPAQEIFRSDRAGIQTEVQQIIQTHPRQLQARRARQPGDDRERGAAAGSGGRVRRSAARRSRTSRSSRKTRATTPIRCSAMPAARRRKIREDAAAYKNRVVQEAEGEAARFISVYNAVRQGAGSDAQAALSRNDGAGAGGANKVVVEPGTNGAAASCRTCRCRRCSARPRRRHRPRRHRRPPRRRERTEP